MCIEWLTKNSSLGQTVENWWVPRKTTSDSVSDLNFFMLTISIGYRARAFHMPVMKSQSISPLSHHFILSPVLLQPVSNSAAIWVYCICTIITASMHSTQVLRKSCPQSQLALAHALKYAHLPAHLVNRSLEPYTWLKTAQLINIFYIPAPLTSHDLHHCMMQ